MFGWEFDLIPQEFGDDQKSSNVNKKTTVKKQSSSREEVKIQPEYNRKQKGLKTPKREASLDKYINVKQQKRDSSSDKYSDKKHRTEKNIHKADEKKSDRSKTKEKDNNVKTKTQDRLSKSKSTPQTSIPKEKEKKISKREKQPLGTPIKQKVDSKSTSRLKPNRSEQNKTSNKTNDQDRSRTATLSRGDNKTLESSVKTPDKKGNRHNDNQNGDTYIHKYDPRKKERELEKKAKESLEKVYNYSSSKKEKKTTPSKKNSDNKNISISKDGGHRTYDDKKQQKFHDNFETESQIESFNSATILQSPSSLRMKIDDHISSYATPQDSLISEASNKTDNEEENEYEDDFESYESDFEECTESGVSEDEDLSITDEDDDDLDSDSSDSHGKPTIEEERKLDSGNYDLATQRRQISEINDAIKKENSLYNDSKLSRNGTNQKNDSISNQSSENKIFINFTNARQRQRKEKVKAAIQNRGDRLLEMIRLDAMGFSILDLPSVPYEVYIQCYGKSNSIQMHTQTNEESLSEEVQTEDIKVCSKWTQHPVAFRTSTSDPQDLLKIFARERIGVGCDDDDNITESCNPNSHTTSMRLHNFLSAAAEVMLVLLEEEEEIKKRKTESILSNKTKNLVFSDGHIPLMVENVTFLKGRCITHIRFSPTAKNQIVTVHKASETEPKSLKEESLGRCMLCVWSIHEPSMPQKILVSPNEVSSVVMYDSFVIAGLHDGSVSLWDLREKLAWHQRTGVLGINWTLNSPTFITAKMLNETAHGSSVVSIQCLLNKTPEDESESTFISQVATLEEEGIIIIWTVVDLLKFRQSDYSVETIIPGMAPWGRVRLVCSSLIDVSTCFTKLQNSKTQYKVMAINNNHIYVGTNTGLIAHCLQPSGKAQSQIYKARYEESSSINCVEISPYGHPMFMAGTNGGRVRLFLDRFEFPLVDVSGTVTNPGPAVVSLQWSPHKPGVFFILDENSSIHVWNLCNSDIFPMFSVSMKDAEPSVIQISPHSDTSLLAIGTKTGAAEIHKLTSELGLQSELTKQKEMEVFKHYISIL